MFIKRKEKFKDYSTVNMIGYGYFVIFNMLRVVGLDG